MEKCKLCDEVFSKDNNDILCEMCKYEMRFNIMEAIK